MTGCRSILAVTGIRSDYDLMTPVYQAIQESPELDLQLLVTGAHLSPRFGFTVEGIEADGFPIAARIESLIDGDRGGSRVKGLAIQLQGMVQVLERIAPDLLLVLGDREEAMSTALAGAYMNIPIAHVSGGDRTIGHVDDQVRHAVTRLVHLHLATNSEAAERILKMGEQAFRIHTVGSPGLDRLRTTPRMPLHELEDALNLQLGGLRPLVVIQHPLSSERQQAAQQMRVTMEAVNLLGFPTVIICPNSDAGSRSMISVIEESRGLPRLCITRNLPRNIFVNLMRWAGCLLGNSSAGILEAPFLGLPAVNVGNRQCGRLHAGNVQFIPHDVDMIVSAVNKACMDYPYRKVVAACGSPYGDGHAAERIVQVLRGLTIDERLLIKEITL